MRRASLLLIPFLLTGCPDPRETAGGGSAGGGNAAAGGGNGGGGGEGGEGEGAGPPPGGATMPDFANVGKAKLKISGTFENADGTDGTLRIDFVRVGGNGQMEILHVMTLDDVGAWEVEAPDELGKIGVVAFVDSANDGPDEAEPSDYAIIEIEDDDVTGVALSTKADNDNPFAKDADATLQSKVFGEIAQAGSAPPPPDGGEAGQGEGDQAAAAGEAIPPGEGEAPPEGEPAPEGAAAEGAPAEGAPAEGAPAEGEAAAEAPAAEGAATE